MSAHAHWVFSDDVHLEDQLCVGHGPQDTRDDVGQEQVLVHDHTGTPQLSAHQHITVTFTII